jgi:hypothetical protein
MSEIEPEYVDIGGALIEKNKLDAILNKGIRRSAKKMSEKTTEYLMNNFEILEPPKRTAVLLGETIELSKIPARVSLKFIAFSKKHDIKELENATEETLDMSVLEDVLDLVALICQKSNSKIDKEWLLDNLSITDLMKFVNFVFTGITQLKDEGEAGGEDGKNSESGT